VALVGEVIFLKLFFRSNPLDRPLCFSPLRKGGKASVKKALSARGNRLLSLRHKRFCEDVYRARRKAYQLTAAFFARRSWDDKFSS
jgi:hypothetical protein